MTSQIVDLKPKPDADPALYAGAKTWVITAPWAHPFWTQYIAFLYPLVKGMVRFKAGMTHEFMLYALDPENPPKIDENGVLRAMATLQPANMGYQFIAESNEAAAERIQGYINRVDDMTLSPDTDYRSSMWDPLFLPEGKSLRANWGESTMEGETIE
jgi:hypothetical protein